MVGRNTSWGLPMRTRLGSHGHVSAILLSAVGCLLLPTLGIAGPNRGAVLIAHTDDTLDYSLGDDYSGESGRECPDRWYDCWSPDQDMDCYANLCNANPTSHRGSDLTVWWVLLGVPVGNGPS